MSTVFDEAVTDGGTVRTAQEGDAGIEAPQNFAVLDDTSAVVKENPILLGVLNTTAGEEYILCG